MLRLRPLCVFLGIAAAAVVYASSCILFGMCLSNETYTAPETGDVDLPSLLRTRSEIVNTYESTHQNFSSKINSLRVNISHLYHVIVRNHTEAEAVLSEGDAEPQFLFFRPRCCSGINNQLEEVWYGMQLALLIGRGIVLPHVAENVTWDDPEMSRLHPFDQFYDVGVVSQLLPTISLQRWKVMCNSTFELDIFPARTPKIVQKKYEQYLKIKFEGVPRLLVSSYRELQNRSLPRCLGVQWPLRLLGGMLQTHLHPGDPPYGGLVERNAQFEVLRRHTIAAPHIMAAVAPITHALGRYLAVHVRVGDFRAWCSKAGKEGHEANRMRCPSFPQMSDTLRGVAEQHKLTKVFVACAAHYMRDTLLKFQSAIPNLTFHTFHSNEPVFQGHPDVVGMAETQVCIDAPVFIGNAYSTWTRTVHQLRHTSGKRCTTSLLWNYPRPWCVTTGRNHTEKTRILW
jgi:hypothetical protein